MNFSNKVKKSTDVFLEILDSAFDEHTNKLSKNHTPAEMGNIVITTCFEFFGNIVADLFFQTTDKILFLELIQRNFDDLLIHFKKQIH